MADLVASRLRAQHLAGPRFGSAVEAVRHFGAVQAQDYAAAKWALGLRVRDVDEAALDRAYDEGTIVRTHVLRPTWHFVAPEDVRWMLALTGPRLERALSSRYQRLELDPQTMTRALTIFEKALSGGRHLTRPELGRLLEARGIAPDGQRLPHLLIAAEFRGLVTSGPRSGRQLSFALLDERVPKGRVLDRDEGLAELTRRYFLSHGPALLRDFVWWSGLTQAEARRGLAGAGDALSRREYEGQEYWFDAHLRPAGRVPASAYLLPNFDEYTVGYTDRSAILHSERPFRPELFAFSSILSNVVLIGGQVHGAWRRLASSRGLRIEVRPLGALTRAERDSVAEAALRFGAFFGRSVEIVWL